MTIVFEGALLGLHAVSLSLSGMSEFLVADVYLSFFKNGVLTFTLDLGFVFTSSNKFNGNSWYS